MGLESELIRFTAVISEYLLVPFSAEPRSSSTVIIATLAYPLGLSLLLTNAASCIASAVLRGILATLERVCLLILMILASPAWLLSSLSSSSVRQGAFGGEEARESYQQARTAHDESRWERPAEFVSELYPAFDVLGVRPDASHSEIRRAYRHLMKLHHPDRFMKASPAQQERARRRTIEIRAAYEDALSSHPYIH